MMDAGSLLVLSTRRAMGVLVEAVNMGRSFLLIDYRGSYIAVRFLMVCGYFIDATLGLV
jgi:hypothetical protein